ncbi:hypothetical protein ILYODFUR_014733 [Ilyodon furcidens]|uniref:Uncharacterized protein n=1 Tax=Ilyodon furcidens TaxID=33524 RepID=A0ABV0V375_9TELE
MLLSFASGCFTQWHIYCNPGFTLYLLQFGPVRSAWSPEELQEPHADRAIKASDKCGKSPKQLILWKLNQLKCFTFHFVHPDIFLCFVLQWVSSLECREAIFVA